MTPGNPPVPSRLRISQSENIRDCGKLKSKHLPQRDPVTPLQTKLVEWKCGSLAELASQPRQRREKTEGKER